MLKNKHKGRKAKFLFVLIATALIVVLAMQVDFFSGTRYMTGDVTGETAAYGASAEFTCIFVVAAIMFIFCLLFCKTLKKRMKKALKGKRNK